MNETPLQASIRSDFIEKTGMITQAEGLPRIAGRVFGMLVFDGDVVSFADLSTRLQVSRASISTSIRLLEERGLVKRIAKPGERQDFFQLAPDPYVTMLQATRKRMRSTRAEIADTINSLPPGADAAGRLTAYAEFYGCIDTSLGMALEDLRTSTATTKTPPPPASRPESKPASKEDADEQ